MGAGSGYPESVLVRLSIQAELDAAGLKYKVGITQPERDGVQFLLTHLRRAPAALAPLGGVVEQPRRVRTDVPQDDATNSAAPKRNHHAENAVECLPGMFNQGERDEVLFRTTGVELTPHGVPTVRYESGDLHEDLSTLAKLERGRTSGA